MNIIKSIFVWFLGIIFVLIFFPFTFIIWVLVLPFDHKRQIVHWLLVNQSYLLVMMMPVWDIKIEGREKAVIGMTYVIISNHQSIIDILILNSLRYRFKWISKIENRDVPFLGWYLRMAGYITVDRTNEESKAKMLVRSFSCLKDGTSIMIFPEGTRSPDKEIGFLKRGAFQLAIEANVPILPVLVDGTGDILPKHGWIFRSNHKISIRVLDPVFPSTFETENAEVLALKFSSVFITELNRLRANNK